MRVMRFEREPQGLSIEAEGLATILPRGRCTPVNPKRRVDLVDSRGLSSGLAIGIAQRKLTLGR